MMCVALQNNETLYPPLLKKCIIKTIKVTRLYNAL